MEHKTIAKTVKPIMYIVSTFPRDFILRLGSSLAAAISQSFSCSAAAFFAFSFCKRYCSRFWHGERITNSPKTLSFFFFCGPIVINYITNFVIRCIASSICFCARI